MHAEPELTYPVRPKPLLGESTLGYLHRVAKANGLGSSRQLFSSLRDRQQGAFDELCDRLILSPEERAFLFGPLPAHWGHPKVPLELGMADFNQTQGRWCPLCLREECTVPGQWTLKLACTCSKHGVWLQETCSRCGANLSWSDVAQSEGRCHCGASLSEPAVEEASDDVQALTSLLCGNLSGASRLTILWALSTPQVHRLVRYLGPFQASNRPAHPGQNLGVHRITVARDLVAGAANLLADWPAQLHTKVAEIRAAAPTSPSVRRTFDPLYRVLYEALQETEFQFLRDAFEDYLHVHWWGLVCKRNKRLHTKTVQDHPRLSLLQMAKAAQVPPSVVRHMVQAELVPSSSAVLTSGRHARSIHVSELPRIKNVAGGGLSLEETAQMLFLPKRRVRELILARLLTPLVSRQFNSEAAAWLIPRDEVDRLHIQGSRAAENTKGIVVRDVLKYWRLREHEGVALIAALVDGQLQTMGASQGSVPIGAAVLSAAEAKEWLLKHRASTTRDYSVDAAAKMLGIKQEVAYDLVRTGLLRSTTAGVLGQRMSGADIELFQATYVSLADLAREGKRSPRALLAELSATPVCGPAVDGARQYFYRRSEIAV